MLKGGSSSGVGQQARGLTQFIADIRNCANKAAEQKRVDKELAKIRAKFATGKKLDSYGKKKYTWKLIYMHTLGYEVDFGLMEAISLVSSAKVGEKQVGYVAVTLLTTEHDENLRLVTNSIKNDLHHPHEYVQSLALTCVANVAGKEFSEALAPDVQKLLMATNTTAHVRKKAALCLLRLFRRQPDILFASEWSSRFVKLLDEERNVGVLLSLMSLLLGVVAHDADGYEETVPKVCKILNRLIVAKEITQDYLYYAVACPWLQVKLLRYLQYFPPPPNDTLKRKIGEVLSHILDHTDVTKNVNKNNATHAVLFEAFRLVIHMESDQGLMSKCVSRLGRFISIREPNMRYLGLETMARLSMNPDNIEHIKRHQSIIMYSLKDVDISIRRRALDLLYAMCDQTNSSDIVEELLRYLAVSDFVIREELVLKIAILAERYAGDLRWYIDVVLQLMQVAGDFVSEEVGFRVIQIITNNEDLQPYAAKRVIRTLGNKSAHENTVRVCAYILGEFGHLVADDPSSTPERQFDLLYERLRLASPPTKHVILSAFVKFYNGYQEVEDMVTKVFDMYRNHIDVELQQRANEYASLVDMKNEDLTGKVWDVMPKFPEKDDSFLIKRLLERRGSSADKATWSVTKAQKGGAVGGTPTSERPKSIDLSNVAASNSGSNRSSRREDGVVEVTETPVAEQSVELDNGPSPSAPPANEDEDDLLGLSNDTTPSAPPSGPPPGIQPQPDTPASDNDLIDVSAPQPPAAPVPVPDDGDDDDDDDDEEVALEGPALEAFKKLCLAPSGVLYENHLLQIGVKAEYKGKLGRFGLFFGNKSPDSFTNFRVSVSDMAELRTKWQDPADEVSSKAQAQMMGMIECQRPFYGSPTMSLSFNHSEGRFSIKLKVPIVVTKFNTELQITAREYMEDWKKFTEEERCTAVFKAAKPIDAEFLAKYLEGLNLEILHSDATAFTTAGLFHCSTGGEDDRCLLRLEMNEAQQAYRLTVGSILPELAETVKELVVSQLGE